jgi:hypothetical protein
MNGMNETDIWFVPLASTTNDLPYRVNEAIAEQTILDAGAWV